MDSCSSDDRTARPVRRRSEHGTTFTTFDIDTETQRKLQAFAERYQLTMAELRLVVVLREGTGLKAAARRIGVGYETVRTQVKSVFMKTGTKRQAEIISFLADFKPE